MHLGSKYKFLLLFHLCLWEPKSTKDLCFVLLNAAVPSTKINALSTVTPAFHKSVIKNPRWWPSHLPLTWPLYIVRFTFQLTPLRHELNKLSINQVSVRDADFNATRGSDWLSVNVAIKLWAFWWQCYYFTVRTRNHCCPRSAKTFCRTRIKF